MGVVPIYAFLRCSGKVPDFHGKNLATCHLTFMMEIRHCFTLGNMECDNHTRGRVGIYIHTSCTMPAHKARKEMPTSLEHDPKYSCRKVNKPYSRDEDEWYMA